MRPGPCQEHGAGLGQPAEKKEERSGNLRLEVWYLYQQDNGGSHAQEQGCVLGSADDPVAGERQIFDKHRIDHKAERARPEQPKGCHYYDNADGYRVRRGASPSPAPAETLTASHLTKGISGIREGRTFRWLPDRKGVAREEVREGAEIW